MAGKGAGAAARKTDRAKTKLEREGAGLSVERVFLILEMLAAAGRPKTLTEISVGLNLPKSSLLKLLRSLSNLGYLSENPVSKTYFPSLGVCNLGKRIEDLLVGHNEHVSMLEDLRDAVGETVGLATQHGVFSQYHSCLAGPQQLNFNLTDGVRYPIHVSAAGRALMSAMGDDEFEKLAYRIENARHPGFEDVDIDRLRREVRQIRKRGFATSDSRFVTNIHSLAKLLPLRSGARPIAVSIGGPKTRIKANKKQILETLSDVIAQYYPSERRK